MELSQFTDYALRALIFVGMREAVASGDAGEESVAATGRGGRHAHLPSVREIADAFQISQHHLVKVVHRLGQLGYLETYRGRGGGIALAMAPGDIRIGSLVRQTENLAVVECLAPGGGAGGMCCIAPACELKRVLARARNAFLAILDGCTLADLLKPRNALRELLQLQTGATRALTTS